MDAALQDFFCHRPSIWLVRGGMPNGIRTGDAALKGVSLVKRSMGFLSVKTIPG